MAYRRRRRFRRSGRRIAKGPNSRTKRMVDGRTAGWIRAGTTAIPYLIKSVSMLKGLINSELHYKDTTLTGSIGSTMQFNGLTLISQGDTDTTREGNKILAHDVYGRFEVVKHDTAVNDIVRIVLLVDKEQDGTVATGADLLQTVSVYSPLNQVDGKRFVIIKDWTFPLTTDRPVRVIKFYKKVPFHIHYADSGGTITSAKENHIFLALLTNDNTNQATYSGIVRFRWYDN